MELDDDGSCKWIIRRSEDFEPLIDRVGVGAEVKNEHLIFSLVDDITNVRPCRSEFGSGEVTEKHTVLGVVALAFKEFEDLVAAFIVADIIGDEVVSSGHLLPLITLS